MDLHVVEELASDLDEFAGDVFKYLALQTQRGYGRQYVRGLLLDGKRKSVEPVAERLGIPRQNLGHFIGQSTWDYTEVMQRLAARATAVVQPTAWIIDDHPFVRYGRHTAGAMAHCGEREQHLCQVAVSVHATSPTGSTPLHWRLFVPKLRAEDQPRCAAAGIPATITHRTKQKLALDLVDELARWGLAPPLVIADSDYGNNVAFRTGLSDQGIPWLLAVTGAPVTAWSRRRPPLHVDDIAAGHRYRARRYVYRRKTRQHAARSGWFVAVPVHIAGIIERDYISRHVPERVLPQRTLVVQWRRKRGGDVFRSWITDLPSGTPLSVLVRHATSRWSIETGYREMEQALGLGDFEGRTYNGFHHHVTLVSAAHLFCLEQRLNPKGPAAT
ncbi:IS701 family transposase [Streptomyces olivoreticuli]|uniref:IS701 family transposase n=1 Tax=Streptomyces olivoreticuli TaxID=68246 RepID=UPI00265AD432|nr:IS701 family transposase [Streptomyces olivoreticuli]WKK24250.1 IS701 family transposase [Streptomyces olivoreticuli]